MSLTSAPVVPCSCAEGWKPEGWAYCADCYEGQIERLRRRVVVLEMVISQECDGDFCRDDLNQMIVDDIRNRPQSAPDVGEVKQP